MNPISLKLGLQQRVLAEYRIPFFESLGKQFTQGLGLFFGDALSGEMIEQNRKPDNCTLIHAYNLDIFSGVFYLCWQIGIVHWLENWNPDVLILEANPRYMSQISAVRWMHQKKRPVIGWGLGAPQIKGILSPLRKLLRNRFLSQFDAIITYSQAGAMSYRAAGIRPQRIFVAHNAVTHKPAFPLIEKAAEWGQNRPIVLFVGRLQARKRVDFLIRACASLPENLRPLLKVVGDGPEKEMLQALAKDIYAETEFLGAKFGSELEGPFRSSDLFVLPGTGGLAIQEAMSFGLPIIAAEADGTQADLVRPQNGWCIQPGDQESLNQTLREALSDIGRLRRYGRESYRIVSEEINLEKMVEVFGYAAQYAYETGKLS